jgi:SPP1 family predicted phage head-tail adaptor
MDIGQFKHKITLKQGTMSKDQYGGEVLVYNDIMTLKCAVNDLGGIKTVINDEVVNSQTIEFTRHYRSTINEEMLIEYNNNEYTIEYIDEIGHKRGLVIRGILLT